MTLVSAAVTTDVHPSSAANADAETEAALPPTSNKVGGTVGAGEVSIGSGTAPPPRRLSDRGENEMTLKPTETPAPGRSRVGRHSQGAGYRMRIQWYGSVRSNEIE